MHQLLATNILDKLICMVHQTCLGVLTMADALQAELVDLQALLTLHDSNTKPILWGNRAHKTKTATSITVYSSDETACCLTDIVEAYNVWQDHRGTVHVPED